MAYRGALLRRSLCLPIVATSEPLMQNTNILMLTEDYRGRSAL
jgi:hypothetical protein